MNRETEWTPPHSHDPNPSPPANDPTFWLVDGESQIRLSPIGLLEFPQVEVADCYIVSTGHGTSGPFRFGGVTLLSLVDHFVGENWTVVDVISADGFRTRLTTTELRGMITHPVLLALRIDGRELTRGEGLVRLIVPHETEDALRHVKWVSKIRINRN